MTTRLEELKKLVERVAFYNFTAEELAHVTVNVTNRKRAKFDAEITITTDGFESATKKLRDETFVGRLGHTLERDASFVVRESNRAGDKLEIGTLDVSKEAILGK